MSVLLPWGPALSVVALEPLTSSDQNVSWGENFVPSTGMFLGQSHRQPILSLEPARGSLMSCFLPPYQLGQFVFPTDS